jgi:hypothetical protein
MIAAMRGSDIVFTPRFRPLDRPADLLGKCSHQTVFRIKENLGSKAAAHLRGKDAHLCLGNAEDEGGHQQPHDVRILRGHPHGIFLRGGLVLRDRPSHLHHIRNEALVDQPLFDHNF